MDALLLALLLTLALEQGTETQRFVARVAAGTPRPGFAMPALVLLSALICLVAAILGAALAATLSADARLLFLSLALVIAGSGQCGSAIRSRTAAPAPCPVTAAALVRYGVRRSGENAAFVTAGVAAYTHAPLLTAGGAIVGTLAAFCIALTVPVQMLHHRGVRVFQILTGFVLLCAGIIAGADALHLL